MAEIDFQPHSDIDFIPHEEDTFIGNLPKLAKEALRIAPGVMLGRKNPKQALSNRATATGQGFKDIGQGISQATRQLGEATGLNAPGSTLAYTRKKDAEHRAYENSQAGKDPFAQLFRSAASSSPYLALGPIFGSEAALLAKMGLSGAANAGLNSLEYVPEGESRGRNALVGGAIGAGLPLIPEAPRLAEAGFNALRPTSLMGRFLSSPLSREELARNLEVTAGTPTGLGNVIGSPTLKRLQENVISKIPFTGGNAALQETGSQILSRGNNVVDSYLDRAAIRREQEKLGRELTKEELAQKQYEPYEHEDIPEHLGESLITARNENTALKNKLYNEADALAQKSGLRLTLPTFSGLAKKHINAIENTNILQFDPETRNLLAKLHVYKSPVKILKKETPFIDENGKKIVAKKPVYPTLKEANILSGRLQELSDQYAMSTAGVDRGAAGVLGQLSRVLKQDIRNQVSKHGNPELIKSFNTAEKNYANNFSPLLDKDIHKFTAGKKSADDLLETFIRTSKSSDKAQQLEKLFKVLPEKDHDLVRAAYFSRAMEGPEGRKVTNPNKLKTLWTQLGDRQKKILVPDKSHRRYLDNFVSLTEMNQKATNMMWNPLTGQINSDLVTALMLANPLTSLKEIGLGRFANKLLTGEKSRGEIVNKLIEKKSKIR